MVAKWRSPEDRVAGLGGLTVQAHCHHLSIRLNYLFTKGLSYGQLGKWQWAWGKLLLERYSNMLSEKSSLVFTVMLSRSKVLWLLEHMHLCVDPLGHL